MNEEFTWFEPGVLGTWTGTDRWYPPFEVKIFSIRASVHTAPTGAAIKVDINKNGSSILVPALHPTIAATTNTIEVTAIRDPLMALGDYLTFDIDQVGSTVAGSDLAITIGFTVCPSATALPGPPPPGQTCYPDVVLNDEPIAFWRMDAPSGTSETDATGNGHTLTLSGTGMTYGVAGAIACDSDPAIDFTQSGGLGDGQVALNLSSYSAITLEFWFKYGPDSSPGPTGSDQLAFEFTSNWNGGGGSFIVDPNNGTIPSCTHEFAFGLNGNVGVSSRSFVPPGSGNDGLYHHYVLVFDMTQVSGSELAAYVDGVAQSLSDGVQNNNTGAFANSTLYFMSRAASTLHCGGWLDDVAIYGYAFTATQASDHYQAGI